MRPRPLEVKALVPLLQQDWESPEELAAALIAELDNARASRTTYIGVMQFGKPGNVWYSALGPYPGRASASKALAKDPSRQLATALAVVPLTSPLGLAERLARTDSKAVSSST